MKVAKEQIRQCFDCWTESWNNGDMDGYLDGYLDSPQTRYVSGKKVFRGKENIVENLKSRGGPKGVLSLLEFEVELMADCKDALCFGQYQLVDGDETHNGCFTVHVRKIVETEEKEGTTWKMVSDHSS
jgi:ketosteroid isomerase-like protein